VCAAGGADAEDVVGFIRNKMGFYKNEKRFPRKDTVADVISKSTNKDCFLMPLANL